MAHQSTFAVTAFWDVSDFYDLYDLYFRGSPSPPTNHPYIITCGTVEKLSKMVGNSAI